jgi:transposase
VDNTIGLAHAVVCPECARDDDRDRRGSVNIGVRAMAAMCQ